MGSLDMGLNSWRVSGGRCKKQNFSRRGKSTLLEYSVYLHRDEKVEEGKQELTKTTRRESMFSKPVGQNPGHKRCQQLHNTTAWLENRSPWDEPEGKI